jgi:hypothetical protein
VSSATKTMMTTKKRLRDARGRLSGRPAISLLGRKVAGRTIFRECCGADTGLHPLSNASRSRQTRETHGGFVTARLMLILRPRA